MWPFKAKPKTEPYKLPPPKTITFRPDDDMFQRAENIWYSCGFVNDRLNHIPAIAGYLSMYRDWDRKKEK
jgi:hypothetical protein